MTIAELDSGEIRERRSFSGGAVAGFFGRGTGFGLQYFFLAAVGRALGAEGAAPTYALIAAATALAVLGRAGLDRFGLREIAAAIARDRAGIIRRLVIRLIALQLAAAGLAGVAIYALREQLVRVLDLGETSLVAWMWVLTVGLMLSISLSEYMLAYREVIGAALVKTIVPYGTGLVILSALQIGGHGIGVRHVLGGLLVGVAVALFVALARLWRLSSGAIDSGEPLPSSGLTSSLSLAAVPLLMMGLNGIDVILLQAAQPGAQTAYYQAARRTAMTLAIGLVAINGIAAPMIAAAFARGRAAELERTVARASRWSLQQATVIGVFLVLCGRWILGWFGSEFSVGYEMLVVLLLAQLVNAAAGPVVQLFVMTGHESAAFRLLAAVLALALPGFFLAARAAGGLGVAAVTAAAFVAWNGGLVLLARRRFGVWTYADNWPYSTALLAGAGALAYGTTGGGLSAWGLAYAGAAVVASWFVCLGADDREMLLEAIAFNGRGRKGVRA